MNANNKQYQQLTQEQRYHISGLRKVGISLREIASDVGVHFSTVSREISRNSAAAGYDPQLAQKMSMQRKLGALKANKRTELTDDSG